MLASSGLARSSSSPLGSILFLTRATSLLRSLGKFSTKCHNTGAFSRSARIASRADIACSQRRAVCRIATGSRLAPSTRNRAIASAGSVNPLKCQLTPRFLKTTHSASAASSRRNSETSPIGASDSTRRCPGAVCAFRFINPSRCWYSKVVNACVFNRSLGYNEAM